MICMYVYIYFPHLSTSSPRPLCCVHSHLLMHFFVVSECVHASDLCMWSGPGAYILFCHLVM